jgi:DNA-directed RNA polymerase subunit RPC12/RpoP
MDAMTISGAISGLKGAADIAKSMIGLRDATVIQGKVVELQSAILAAQTSALAAQSEQFALIEQIRALKEEIARAKAWEREKEKYELKELHPRSLAYAIKPDAQGSQPNHYLCANCFEQGEKRILQDDTYIHIACPHCKTRVQYKASPRHDY